MVQLEMCNPNPYADGSQVQQANQRLVQHLVISVARYGDMFNPGEERGFTPGDGGNGDETPEILGIAMKNVNSNDNGDPIDPLTGFGGPSGPQVDDGSPIDPDEDFDSSGPGDDLWKPNPDDVWGGGPNSNSSALFGLKTTSRWQNCRCNVY